VDKWTELDFLSCLEILLYMLVNVIDSDYEGCASASLGLWEGVIRQAMDNSRQLACS
jgi:hypothetical protein